MVRAGREPQTTRLGGAPPAFDKNAYVQRNVASVASTRSCSRVPRPPATTNSLMTCGPWRRPTRRRPTRRRHLARRTGRHATLWQPEHTTRIRLVICALGVHRCCLCHGPLCRFPSLPAGAAPHRRPVDRAAKRFTVIAAGRACDRSRVENVRSPDQAGEQTAVFRPLPRRCSRAPC